MIADKLSSIKELENIEKIYSSFYSSALSTAKYLANKLELDIIMDECLNDCKVGSLGNKNMKMVKGIQDHEFTYKLPNGESLVDVGNRLKNFISSINNEVCVLFSHKRAILGYLLRFSEVGYNLDENLILEYNGNIIYDDSETEFDVYEITIVNNEVSNIHLIR